MNERIQELIRLSAVPVDQAKDYALSKGLVESTERLDVAKFAELIVRECAKHFDDVYQKSVIVPPRVYTDSTKEEETAELNWRSGWLTAYESAGGYLLEHFGVEE